MRRVLYLTWLIALPRILTSMPGQVGGDPGDRRGEPMNVSCKGCKKPMSFVYDVHERETVFVLWECTCGHKELERKPAAAGAPGAAGPAGASRAAPAPALAGVMALVGATAGSFADDSD